MLACLLGLLGAALAAPLDLNAATAAELDRIPGIGPAKAQAIVEHRAAFGPFTSVDALADIPSIGPATVAIARPHLRVGPPPSDPRAKRAASAGDGTDPDDAERVGPSSLVVDINTADEATLRTLPGINPTRAAAIFADRKENGPFFACADLARVPGLGAATLALVEPQCTAGPHGP